MTILEYIQSKVRISLTDENVQALLLDRDLLSSSNADASSLSAQTRELLYADALMLISTSPNVLGGASRQHGGFSQKDASESINATDRYVQMAMDIYKKWGDDKYNGDESLSWVDNEY